ncbi:MAG: hypothetical protein K0S00_1748, partial [Xanthobacteraceae bacterium]|nr:hypothetical protein [Xanthobacteraceae bacterium]
MRLSILKEDLKVEPRVGGTPDTVKR